MSGIRLHETVEWSHNFKEEFATKASRQDLANIAAAFSINKTDTSHMNGKYICFSLKGAPSFTICIPL